MELGIVEHRNISFLLNHISLIGFFCLLIDFDRVFDINVFVVYGNFSLFYVYQIVQRLINQLFRLKFDLLLIHLFA